MAKLHISILFDSLNYIITNIYMESGVMTTIKIAAMTKDWWESAGFALLNI